MPVFAVTVPDGEWDKMDRLAFEREMLGLYVSDHPLLGVEHVLAAHAELPGRRAARPTRSATGQSCWPGSCPGCCAG